MANEMSRRVARRMVGNVSQIESIGKSEEKIHLRSADRTEIAQKILSDFEAAFEQG